MELTFLGKTRSGKREWMFQRIANLSIIVWGTVFILQLYLTPETGYAQWQAMFSPLWFKLYTSLTLLVISLNSVLAGWQISTDYVKNETANKIFMLVCMSVTALYTVAGLYALWILS